MMESETKEQELCFLKHSGWHQDTKDSHGSVSQEVSQTTKTSIMFESECVQPRFVILLYMFQMRKDFMLKEYHKCQCFSS